MKKLARNSVILGLTLVVLAGAALSGTWAVMSSQTHQAIDDWAQTKRAEGIETQWSELGMSGFPIRVSAHFMNPALDIEDSEAIRHWAASSLTAEYYLYEPSRVRFSAPGRHEIRYATVGGELRDLIIDAADARLDLHDFGDGNPMELVLDLQRVSARSSIGDDWQVETLSAQYRRRAAAPEQVGAAPGFASAVVKLEIAGLSLPPDLASPFDRHIEHIVIDIAVSGILEPSFPAKKSELAAWRDDGGYLELREVVIEWGPLSARGTGRIALDDALQPQGRIAARASGLLEIVDTMQQAGLIDSGGAMIARLAIFGLSAFGGNQDDGPSSGEDVFDVTFDIRDTAVFLGPVKLFKFEPIEWR